ncbi:sensor histidine kinase [Brevundimonas alba]|uniref:sensor histidine kinase n=1 Tax=Brevundimonas alba TaxID=74314 RepID=UPI001FD870B8|nr:sensor histidine kinase [Brevundimonas alba]
MPALIRFARTPSIGRSIVSLLAGAILLLLAVNIATFVMIQRTAAFNDQVERSQQVRRAARTLLISMIDAETGQRGYLLTGRQDFLEPYTRAETAAPVQMEALEELAAGDPELRPHVESMVERGRDKLAELERVSALARTGRNGEALRLVQTGQGKALMDRIRADVAAIDEIENVRLESRTLQSERGSRLTLWANAFAGLLIVLLAGIMIWLVRRYVEEIQTARDTLDRLNAGLESQVRERTAQLTRANDEIQRFAYIVSHDLRAPLVNIMGYTSELEQAGQVLDRQLARIETDAPKALDAEAATAVREDVPEAIGFIRASTGKMDRLINAILKLSREGRRALLPELLDMTAMAQGIADSVRHQTGEAGAEIVVEPLPRLESDRLSMEQVFGNLIDNAVKYLDLARPGRIVVSGEDEPGGWVVYRIADNGRGVSPRDHERIFELFRRSGKQDRPGEGLGLAFVRNSVRRLGGEITVESELGKGSTFVLKFPTRLTLEESGEAA